MLNHLDCKLYECSAMHEVTGDAIRPGGYGITARAAEFCRLGAGDRVLDVGCGTGATVEFLIDRYGTAATGIDPSEKMLGIGRNRCPDLPLIYGRAEDLPFSGESMDAVISECSLSHTSNIITVMDEIHRILKADGFLILSDIYLRQAENGAELPDKSDCPSGFVTRENLLNNINQRGFEVILWEDYSNELTQLVFDIIMKFGSLDDFFALTSCNQQDYSLKRRISGAKLGYYLLIARKRSCNL